MRSAPKGGPAAMLRYGESRDLPQAHGLRVSTILGASHNEQNGIIKQIYTGLLGNPKTGFRREQQFGTALIFRASLDCVPACRLVQPRGLTVSVTATVACMSSGEEPHAGHAPAGGVATLVTVPSGRLGTAHDVMCSPRSGRRRARIPASGRTCRVPIPYRRLGDGSRYAGPFATFDCGRRPDRERGPRGGTTTWCRASEW